jgi:hypothetical protein
MDEDGPLTDYYREYTSTLSDNISALPTDAFTPDLTALDAVVASIRAQN